MSNANRPWWADREVVESWVEQKHFDATLAYLDGLAEAIEHRIAYGVDDPAVAAGAALDSLDRLWRRQEVVVQVWGGEAVLSLPALIFDTDPLPYQRDDPAHIMVCTCSHGYTDHSDVGCSHCPECSRFRYSHDLDEVTNA